MTLGVRESSGEGADRDRTCRTRRLSGTSTAVEFFETGSSAARSATRPILLYASTTARRAHNRLSSRRTPASNDTSSTYQSNNQVSPHRLSVWGPLTRAKESSDINVSEYSLAVSRSIRNQTTPSP